MLINWIRKIGIILIELAVILGALWFIASKKGIEHFAQIGPALQQEINGVTQKEAIFPQLGNPIERKFTWSYQGVKYNLSLPLDNSVYEYYKTQPKSYSYAGDLPANWEENYYGMFLKTNVSDQSIEQLATKLETLGRGHKLSDDQIADLVLSFVQSIEYDDAKAANILDKTGKETMQYPYETLFLQKGVCSDKSLLAIAILKQLGFGTAIFTYEQDNHMAIGIECPKNYSTYGSGYCYAETTATGNRIGVVPSFDKSTNKTVIAAELATFDSSQVQQLNLQQLGQVTIFQKTIGKQYAGVVETKKIADELDALRKKIDAMLPQLQAQQKLIKNEENKLNSLKNNFETAQNQQDGGKYNNLVGEYNDFLESYKKDVKKYNDSASLYNKSIARYNVLIKQ
jgi:hypothetical protein